MITVSFKNLICSHVFALLLVTKIYFNLCVFKVVRMRIHRVGRLLSYEEVEQSYQEWVLNMHNCYDQEHASGEDDAIVIFHSLDNKSLGISPDCKGT